MGVPLTLAPPHRQDLSHWHRHTPTSCFADGFGSLDDACPCKSIPGHSRIPLLDNDRVLLQLFLHASATFFEQDVLQLTKGLWWQEIKPSFQGHGPFTISNGGDGVSDAEFKILPAMECCRAKPMQASHPMCCATPLATELCDAHLQFIPGRHTFKDSSGDDFQVVLHRKVLQSRIQGHMSIRPFRDHA